MRTVVTTVTITDDLGAPGDAETVRFTYDGRDYEIDLNKRNRETFERRVQALYGQYVAVARDVTKEKPVVVSETQKVRAWAAEQGIEVNDRGRLPEAVMAQYREAVA